MADKTPIFVDLDGTLVRTDVFLESILRLLKSNPLNGFRILGWSMAGRAALKARLARQDGFDACALPYNKDLVEYLKSERTNGRRIVLATAAHWKPARAVAKHLDLFDDVIASDARHNLKGERKLDRIRAGLPSAAFTYCGDNGADRPLWRAAKTAIFVNAPRSDVAEARRRGAVEKEFSDSSSPLAQAIRAMRPHQWAKNALVAVPLLTSHNYLNPSAVLNCAVAFVCFCLCASGVYFLNDMLDLEADRRHRTKSKRPFASGRLSLRFGFAGAILLPLMAFALAFALLPPAFSLVMLGYFALTNAYSFALKSVSTLDVFALSGLYTLRTVAGAAAIDVVLSSWLLLFSIFFFLSLAYLKRYSELYGLTDASAPGRGYSSTDKDSMFTLGIANGIASVLVMALYVQSDEVRRLYRSPDVLLLVCLGLLYWLNRAWVGARRGKINEDPVVFAFRDRVSRGVGALLLLVILAAHYVSL